MERGITQGPQNWVETLKVTKETDAKSSPRRYHLTPVRTAVGSQSTNNSVGSDAEKRECSRTVASHGNGCCHMQKSLEVPQTLERSTL